MKYELDKSYKKIFDAIVELLNPLVEIAAHDLRNGKICYINGFISDRSVGDDSLISTDELAEDIGKVIYSKLNYDGRLVKSISIKLSDNILVCINCDISIFNQMQSFASRLISIGDLAPKELFKNDWQQQINQLVHNFIKENSWNYESLTTVQRKEIAYYLYKIGAFKEKNSVDYIAKIIRAGRATIFNYLKEWRQ